METPPPDITPPITPGTLLGGRVHHAQKATGHRTGLEPVLLAASLPARPGERVLEAGTGTAAALLCLAARIPGIRATGIEREADIADIARANIAANGFTGLEIVTAELADWTAESGFDHAFANPPWHDPAATPSPDAQRDGARRATGTLFADWARHLAARLRPRGTLSLLVGAAHLPACLAAMTSAGCGSLTIHPFWPKQSRPARLVLLRGIRAGRGPATLLPGLVLHEEDGGFTSAAQAILRDGAALE